MSLQRGPNSQSLQELIDSYNAEIMRYSQMARPAQQQGIPTDAANQRAAGERARESGEEEAERGRTERAYWLAEGKQGLQNGSHAAHRPRPEPDEPLYRPGAHMPRPEPNEPLERPECHHCPIPHDMNEPAVKANTTARSMTEQEMWMRELEQGLLELQRGLEELAQGQRDLLAGQEAYRQGIAERDRWRQAAQQTAAQASDVEENVWNTPNVQMPSFYGTIPHFAGQMSAVDSNFSPQSGQMRAQNGMSAPKSQALPENTGIGFSPSERMLMQNGISSADADRSSPFAGNGMQQALMAQGEFDPSRSNVNAPIAPISPEGRTAQSAQSIPADGMGMGYLQVGVYTARQSNPIPNARVMVFRETPEGSELYASATTDDDGKIPLLQMPVGTSSAGGVNAPFAIYNVSVAADGYYPRNELQAQIFDGITALLWVELTPLPDSAWPPAGQ